MQREHGLDQPGNPGRSLGMPEVALDRTQRDVPGAAVTGEVTECLRLHHVAEQGAGAVRLDEADVVRADPGRLPDTLDELLLCPAIGGGDPIAPPVLVDAAPAQHGVHGLAVGQSVAEPAQHQDRDALGPSDSVGRCAEGLASSVRRRETGLGVEDIDDGRHDQVGARCQGVVAVAGAQCACREVDGDERRGAGRVHRQARAFEVEMVRDPVGAHEVAVSGAVAGGDPVVVRQLQIRPFVGHDSDEHSGSGAGQILGGDRRVLDGAPGTLQQQPLLRVHGGRLAW